MAELCREFGIARKTGYKIFERYQECGIQGLTDRSRRSESVSLVIYIISSRADAYQLLNQFDEEWWLANARSSDGLLTFAIQ